MAKNRRANAVNFGFDFQVNSAIVLMLENMEDFSSLRSEGDFEDIEIKLDDDSYILAQAKAVEKSSTDFTNVKKNLEKSLVSLSEGAQKCNAKELILITNSPNPLREKASIPLFAYDAHRTFESLPDSSKKNISVYMYKHSLELDTAKFMIQVLPFETDNEIERYKYVRRAIDDFVGDLNVNVPGLAKRIIEVWQNVVFHNSSKKDAQIVLSKSDVIWPIIVIVTDVEKMYPDLLEIMDPSIYDEVVYRYKNIIDEHCERCEFFIKVLSDYQLFRTTKSISKKPLEFVESKWTDYLDELRLQGNDAEIQKALIKIILFSIISNRTSINNIKRGAKL